ncbi:unnamed protein product, partial [Arabidopsis halleri]
TVDDPSIGITFLELSFVDLAELGPSSSAFLFSFTPTERPF